MRRRTLLGVAGASMAGLSGCLSEPEYTVTDVRVGESSAPLGLEVAVTEPEAVIEHPALFEFTLTNEADAPLRLRNTGIWPFGLLELAPSLDADRGGPAVILWSGQYEESRYVEATSRRNYGVEDTPIVRAIAPGETVDATYELHGDDIGGSVENAGTGYVRGAFERPILEFASGEQAWEPFLPELAVSFEQQSLL
jgi:hypothetical protein